MFFSGAFPGDFLKSLLFSDEDWNHSHIQGHNPLTWLHLYCSPPLPLISLDWMKLQPSYTAVCVVCSTDEIPVHGQQRSLSLCCVLMLPHVRTKDMIQHGALSYPKLIVPEGTAPQGQMPPPCTTSTVWEVMGRPCVSIPFVHGGAEVLAEFFCCSNYWL